jgi:hypothetical protein
MKSLELKRAVNDLPGCPTISIGGKAMTINAGYWLSTLLAKITGQVTTPTNLYNTWVVGSTYEGRQTVVRKLTVDETIQLHREPHNPYDRNAIRVERLDGECFGYISRYEAAKIAPQLDAVGQVVLGQVTRIEARTTTFINLVACIRFEMPEGGEDYDISETDL